MRMRANSLALRLFLSATAWAVVILAHHRHCAVVALSAGGGARFRPPARRLSAHAGRRSSPRPKRRATNFRSRSASRCSSCRCPAGTGRSRASIPASTTCAPRARCGTAACRICRTSALPPAPTARARAMWPARRISGCGWSSATSISATKVITWWRSPATPPKSPTKRAPSIRR